jgi:HEAT repeat protein
MLEGQAPTSIALALHDLAERGGPRVKARTLHLLAELGDTAMRPLAERLLADERDPELQAEAVHYLCMSAKECSLEKLDNLLANGNVYVRGAALASIANCGGSAGTAIAAKALRRMIGSRGPAEVERRAQAAKALARVKPPSPLHSILATLIRDEATEVAVAALEGAGKTRRRDLIPPIVERLCCGAYPRGRTEGLEGLWTADRRNPARLPA